MGTISAIDFNLMGQVVTFDVVTFYGMVCAAIFTTGFLVANCCESRNRRRAVEAETE